MGVMTSSGMVSLTEQTVRELVSARAGASFPTALVVVVRGGCCDRDIGTIGPKIFLVDGLGS